jgi:hypothetical protein
MIVRVNPDGHADPERGKRLWLWCPGCDDLHCASVEGTAQPQWDWNGDTERPTISPSILVRYPTPEPHPNNVCHSFVRDGRWEFLTDSTHHLAGQTVDVVPIPDGWFD